MRSDNVICISDHNKCSILIGFIQFFRNQLSWILTTLDSRVCLWIAYVPPPPLHVINNCSRLAIECHKMGYLVFTSRACVCECSTKPHRHVHNFLSQSMEVGCARGLAYLEGLPIQYRGEEGYGGQKVWNGQRNLLASSICFYDNLWANISIVTALRSSIGFANFYFQTCTWPKSLA